MRKKLSQEVIVGLIVLFTIVLPALAIGAGVFLFKTTPFEYMPFKERMEALKSRVLVTPEAKVVKPSEVLANKAKYADHFLIVRGEVQAEPVICERQTCPEEDPCCGCKNKKNLIIKDAGTPFLAESSGHLPIFAPGEEPICTRKVGSCDYDCQDWRVGDVYDAEGTFWAEAPIAGSGIQLWDFYFEVEKKRLAPKTAATGLSERIKGNFRELMKLFKTSGYYVR